MSLPSATDIAAVLTGTIPSGYTGLILGQPLKYSDRSATLTAVACDSRILDVWTPTVGGAYTDVSFNPPTATGAVAHPAAGSSAANLAVDLADGDIALGQAVTPWYSINTTTAVATAYLPGYVGTFANTTGITWAHTATGSTGTNLVVGRLCARAALTGPGVANVSGAVYPADTNVQGPTTKQIVTLTGASIASGDSIVTEVTFPHMGKSIVVKTAFDTNNNTTMATHATNLETALNALGGGYTAVAANASADVTITADVIGGAFDVNSFVSGTGGGTVSRAYTTGAVGAFSTDIAGGGLLGVLTRSVNVVYDSANGDHVVSGTAGEFYRRGVIAVANSQSPTFGDQVWLDPSTGLCYNAASSGYLPLPKSLAFWGGPGSGGLAPLHIALPV